jgi:hypothetical protein
LTEPLPTFVPQEKPKRKTRGDLARLVEESWKNCEMRRAELADMLGVTVDSLRRCGVGWAANKWVIPECDGAGAVVGITYRTRQGRKFCERGGSRGLVVPSQQWAPPLLIVEGMSDVAACLTIGVAAVGRPSNLGGADMIVALLRRLEWKGSLIVVGERDRKDKGCRENCGRCNQCWPGRFGAEAVAAQIKGNGWSVRVKYPAAKDTRAWLAEHRAATRQQYMKSLTSR